MELAPDGRTAVVIGAAAGAGLAVTRALAAAGVHVVVGVQRCSDALAQLAAEGTVDVVLGDLSDPDVPARVIAGAGGRLDLLVTDVSAATARPGFLEITDAQWQATLERDLMTAVRTMRAALPLMLSAGRGTVITIGSVDALVPDPALVDHGAAGTALAATVAALSREVGRRGIRTITVTPGPAATGEEIAGLVTFLAGDRATTLGGTGVAVNGALLPIR